MDRCVVLALEPKKPAYLKWLSEEEFEDLVVRYELDSIDCLEAFPNGGGVYLYARDTVLCDEYGWTYIYDEEGKVVGVEELSLVKDDPSYYDNVRLAEYNGSHHLLIGPAFVVEIDFFGDLVDMSARNIVKYERLFNRYLHTQLKVS